MTNKKILYLVIIMILGMVISVYAATGDLTDIDTSETIPFALWTFDETLFPIVTFGSDGYDIEVDGKNYNFGEILGVMETEGVSTLKEAAAIIDGEGPLEDTESPVITLNDKTRSIQSININLGSEPVDLDPQKTTDEVSFSIVNATLEGLVRLNPDGSIGEGLAESWEISTDGTEYTFHLRNANWSDGTPITAGDFEYAWLRALNPDTSSYYAYQLYHIKNAQAFNNGEIYDPSKVGIEVVDSKTLKVTLERKTPFFLSLTTFPTYIPAQKSGIEFWGENYGLESNQMVYSGPYIIEEWNHNQNLTLEKNPNYWDSQSVQLDKIIGYMITDGSEMYNNNELDITRVPGGPIETYKSSPEFSSQAEGVTWYLQFNMEDEIFSNHKVREAFALATDAQAYIDQIYNGKGEVAEGFTPPTITGASGQSFGETRTSNLPGYDTTIATQLFNEALIELGITKAEFESTVTLVAGEGDTWTEIAQFFQSQWRDNLGVELAVEQMSFVDRLDRYNSGEYQITYAGWGADYNDPLTFLDMWVTDGGGNDAHFSNPDYDASIQIALTGTGDERYLAMADAEAILAQNLPIYPIYHPTRNLLVKPHVKGLATYPVGPEFDFKWAYSETPIEIVENPVTLKIGEEYVEPGYTAIDNIDGDITSEVIVENTVDVNTSGDYTVTYNVSDSSGNAADEKTRNVVVEENIVPNNPNLNVVSGTISMSEGVAPTGGIDLTVLALGETYPYYKVVNVPEGLSSTTYTLELPEGDYNIGFCKEDDNTVFYSSEGMVIKRDLADNLTIAGDLDGINLLIENNNIEGTISLPEGEIAPVGGIDGYVRAISDKNTYDYRIFIPEGESSDSYSFILNDGDYRFDYVLKSMSEKYINLGYYSSTGIVYYDSADVISVNNDFHNIDITVEKGNLVNGTVSLRDGEVAPVGGIEGYVTAINDSGYGGGNFDFIIPEGQNSTDYQIRVPDDNYTIMTRLVNSTGYVEEIYYNSSGSVTNRDNAEIINITSDISSIDITLVEGYSIKGTVSLPAGEVAPVGGIEGYVTAINDSGYGGSGFDFILPEGQNSGDYQIRVPDDNYKVITILKNSTEYMERIYYSSGGSVSNSYNAELISIDQDISSIDMTLVESYSISGTVSLPDGETAPTGGIEIEVLAYGSSWHDDQIIIEQGASSAEYSINVPKGNFTIRYDLRGDYPYIDRAYYDGVGTTTNEDNATDLTISDVDLSGIDLQLINANTISGIVSLPEAMTEDVDMWIYAESINDGNWFETEVVIPAGDIAVGYNINAIAGDYKISYWLRDNYNGLIQEGYYNNEGTATDYSLGTSITLADTDVSGIDIGLIKGYELSGTVSLPDGDTASEDINVSIDLVSIDGTSTFFDNVVIPAGGTSASYNILAPVGDYKLQYILDNGSSIYVDNGYYGSEGTVTNENDSIIINITNTNVLIDMEILENTISTTGVSVSPSAITLTLGEDYNLTATVEPTNATNKNVNWTSSDESIATVADGVVTPVSKGLATITATTEDGGFTATCQVTVEVDSIINVTQDITYTTIKDALSNAQEGDTIEVAPGTYEETNIFIDTNNITLRSMAGELETIIDARGVSEAALLINAQGVTVDGFTFKNWGKDNDDVNDTTNRHGITVLSNSSNVTITNNIIEFNTEQDYQFIGISSMNNAGPLFITGNKIIGEENQQPEKFKVGIEIDSANATIDNNTIFNTHRAIRLYSFSEIETMGITITNNEINNSRDYHIYLNHEYGTGIDESSILISGNTFGNTGKGYLIVENRPENDFAMDFDLIIQNNQFNGIFVGAYLTIDDLGNSTEAIYLNSFLNETVNITGLTIEEIDGTWIRTESFWDEEMTEFAASGRILLDSLYKVSETRYFIEGNLYTKAWIDLDKDFELDENEPFTVVNFELVNGETTYVEYNLQQ